MAWNKEFFYYKYTMVQKITPLFATNDFNGFFGLSGFNKNCLILISYYNVNNLIV